MTPEERIDCEWFCAEARCYIEGIEEDSEFFRKILEEARAMSDAELLREADWLEDMCGK